MVKLVPIFIFSTLSFAAIDNRKQELPTDLPVKSFKHYNTEEINSLIDFAYAMKEDWISNPLTIASYVITKYSWYDKYDLIQVVKESGK